jgi:hypothetical protein
MDASAYEQAVRDHLQERLLEEGMQDPAFRLDEVSLQRRYPGTRLVVTFKRDDSPDRKYAYWAPLWELVAWTEMHVPKPGPNIRSQPKRLASDFLFDMFHELELIDFASRENLKVHPSPEVVDVDVPEGVVPIRGLVGW